MRKPLPPFVRYQIRHRAARKAVAGPGYHLDHRLDDASVVQPAVVPDARAARLKATTRPKAAAARAPKAADLLHADPSTNLELHMHTTQANPANLQAGAASDIEHRVAASYEALPAEVYEGPDEAKPSMRKTDTKAVTNTRNTNESAKKPAKRGKPGRPRVAPYKEGVVWSYRVRRGGMDIYETGFDDSEAAHEAMNTLIKQLGTGKAPLSPAALEALRELGPSDDPSNPSSK